MSQVTTHVLDTSTGKPAWGIAVKLSAQVGTEWIFVAKGITDKQGRLGNLLKEDEELLPGIYQLNFDTRHYFDSLEIKSFYPFIEVVFEIDFIEHYHIPLLVSPFGYSTYRGS